MENKKSIYLWLFKYIYMKIYIYLNRDMKRRPMGMLLGCRCICSSVTENYGHELW